MNWCCVSLIVAVPNFKMKSAAAAGTAPMRQTKAATSAIAHGDPGRRSHPCFSIIVPTPLALPLMRLVASRRAFWPLDYRGQGTLAKRRFATRPQSFGALQKHGTLSYRQRRINHPELFLLKRLFRRNLGLLPAFRVMAQKGW